MAGRNEAGWVSPPMITRAFVWTESIAVRVLRYRFAYAAAFGVGDQKTELSGSFQISYVSTGWGVRPGCVVQNAPPGP